MPLRTFAHKVARPVEGARVFGVFVIHRFVFGEIIETKVRRQTVDLSVGQRLLQKVGHFDDAGPQILENKSLV